MYYRRKIFLALLESFDGKLDPIDFQKLLFLFCKKSKQNYYDFFPYRYGCFSYLSYQDKRVLTKYGYLKESEKIELKSRKSILNQLKDTDKKNMSEFAKEWKSVSGNKLIKETYLRCPSYAIKSEIADKLLTEEELKEVRNSVPVLNDKKIYTIGYEGLTIDAYLNKLIFNNIRLVVDVRKNPLSMKYGFSKTKLKDYLKKVGIEYVHLPELGIISKLRKNLESQNDYNELFNYYAKNILPENIDSLNKILELLNKHNRIALTCFEADYHSCHRHKITELLSSRQNQLKELIVHI